MQSYHRLADWIEYGRTAPEYQNKRKVRQWIREFQGRIPAINR